MPAAQQAEIDRWLTGRGLPHLIAGYSAREDVLTRALPLLAAIFVLETFLALSFDWPWYGNLAAFLGGVLLLLGAYGLLNRLQGREPLELPSRVGNGEIATFLILPSVLPLVFGGELTTAVGAVLLNAVILGAIYVVTSYGVVPMIRWSLASTWQHLATIGRLTARVLPTLLLFATFLFVNAELWQVAQDFTPATFGLTIALFVGAGLLFFLLRVPQQTIDVGTFSSWAEVAEISERTPAAGLPVPDGAPDDVPPLSRADRVNVALLLTVSQGVQILLVSAVIGAFFFAFGLLAVREATILTWTAATEITPIASIVVLDTTLLVSEELVRVCAFIAAFAGLQFTVSASTDEVWRTEFVDDVVADIRDALAVRTRCLADA